MGFWLIAGAMVVVVGAILGLTLWYGASRGGSGGGSAELGLQVYRDQMAEVDRDLARGVLTTEAAERTRVEIGRRILAADKAAQVEASVSRAPVAARVAALALVAVAGLGSIALYSRLGAPDYPDLGLRTRIALAAEERARRMSQAEAEAANPPRQLDPGDPRIPELVAKLRTVVKERPDDQQGLRMLAHYEAALGNDAAARAAQQKLVDLLGTNATADDLATLVDMMAIAAGGRITPEADKVLARILEMDPRNGPARYYVGLMFAQTGRPDLAFGHWRALLEEGPESAPWIPPIRATIMDLAAIAGEQRYQPPAARGPSAEDMAAASQMSGADRTEMIRGMVDRLGERLATQGGTAEEWARMVRALGVLGERDRADAIWKEAQGVFAGRADELAMIAAAAQEAAVAEGAAGRPAGPSAAEVSAAQDMSDEDRGAMIRGMVDRLETRLTEEGGTPEQWAQLLRSLSVLGDTDRLAAAWSKAQAAFADSPGDLATVRAAAVAAGVAQ